MIDCGTPIKDYYSTFISVIGKTPVWEEVKFELQSRPKFLLTISDKNQWSVIQSCYYCLLVRLKYTYIKEKLAAAQVYHEHYPKIMQWEEKKSEKEKYE